MLGQQIQPSALPQPPLVYGPNTPTNAQGLPFCNNITVPVGWQGPINCDSSQGPPVYAQADPSTGSTVCPTGYCLDQYGGCDPAACTAPTDTSSSVWILAVAVAVILILPRLLK